MNATAAALTDNFRRAAHDVRNGKPARLALAAADAALVGHPDLLDALRHEATILDNNHALALAAFTAGDIFTDPAAATAATAAYNRVADLLA